MSKTKGSGKKTRRERKPVNLEIKMWRFVISPLSNRDEAYEKLRKNSVLKLYYPKYKYEDAVRKAVVLGAFACELPFAIAQAVLRDLAPAWQLGKGPAKAEEASNG